MSETVSVKFLGKEYSVPVNVVAYVELVNFTNGIRDSLVSCFKRKISPSIEVLESDTFMIPEMNEQATKFIRRLLKNDIYTRTVNDYLHNRGYDLFLETKRKAIRQLISIRQEKLDTYRSGVEGAMYRKEASVTGLDFGIISGSFVNHMIYAYMNASEQTKQEKEALITYNREIAELDRQAAEYDRQETRYIHEHIIPAMHRVFTLFAYEMLDQYVSDLIAAGLFDKAALEYIDLERSDDLLENLNLAGNKKAVIESAFIACPFNITVYMQAMKYDFLDYDSFLAAKHFKQDSIILSFLKESVGTVKYPQYTVPNEYSAGILARFTNQTVEQVLFQHTRQYADTVIMEYDKLFRLLNNPERCRDILRKENEDRILLGDRISKQLADSLVVQIVPDSAWRSLITQCGHKTLFGRLMKLLPEETHFDCKAKFDAYLKDRLFEALEAERKVSAQKITEQRATAEAQRQKIESEKQKKRNRNTIIFVSIVALIILALSLPSIIENRKIAKKEAYIEEQIKKVTVPLEQEIEAQITDDIIVDYYSSLQYDWGGEDVYQWSFCIRMNKFEDYIKSGATDEQLLLEVMDNCRIIQAIFEEEYDDLDFEFQYEGERIRMDYEYGNLHLGSISSYETFYYEEYWGNRYLHSYNTEYVLKKEEISPTSANSHTEDNITFAHTFIGLKRKPDGKVSASQEQADFINNDVNLFGLEGRFSIHCSTGQGDDEYIDVLDWNSNNRVDDFDDFLDILMKRYGNRQKEDYVIISIDEADEAYTWHKYDDGEYLLCWKNSDGSVTLRWMLHD